MRIASSSGILMDANGKANGSAPSALVAYFLGMGFSREMVFRAIKEIGDTDLEQILELLLTYQAIGSDPSVGNSSHSACDPQILEEEDEEEDVNWDEDDTVDNFDRATYSDGSGDEDFLQEMSEKDEKIKSLVSMGFPEDEDTEFSSFGGRKKTKLIDGSKKKRERYRSRPQWNQVPFDGSHEEPMPLPNPMVGFSLPKDGLRDIFPNGMNVLSLFSGIGGAEVALHRLGICMKTVVSVEISEVNMTLLRSWWDQTQTGTLIEIADVQNLTAERIELFIRRFGGFDLVIGGSPCNNLAGSNRYHRDGLEGKHSALFYHYYRILDSLFRHVRKALLMKQSSSLTLKTEQDPSNNSDKDSLDK
uniref:DNA (cytosine-5-)-methyltransferase n=1 Tax=Oryza nivara TaxID=4536 RepID=A0A0E0IX23_ORYNI